MTIEVKTIAEVLDRINADGDGGIFLPCIQRDFVWREERIYDLLDSLMRGYPIGTILVWETNTAVNYRLFQKNYVPDTIDNDFDIDDGQHSINRQYILDGQQRLQSLYIALRGYYNGNVLFFNLRSNPQDRYIFKFQPQEFYQDGWLNVCEFFSKKFNADFSINYELQQEGIISIRDIGSDDMSYNAQRLYDMCNKENNIYIQKFTNITSLKDINELYIRVAAYGVELAPKYIINAMIHRG